MDNTRRRAYIKEKLEQADHRLRGMDLAKECGVSRQVIVGDMALLRARGLDIISTPRGYYLKKPAFAYSSAVTTGRGQERSSLPS